jgi:trk system potassium uptake protein TrkA
MAQRIIILGAGRFGTHLAGRLSEFGCDVLLADNNPGRVEDLNHEGFRAVELDAEDESALREAGVQEADAVVVCIGENMQGSILTTLLLKELKVKRVVCRALDARHATVLEKLSADLVVLPTRDMAYRLAERLRDNVGSDRLPLVGDYQIAHVRLGPPLHGQTLAEARLREKYHINVVLLSRPGPKSRPQPFGPAPDLRLALHDILTVSGLREDINRFEQACALPD